MENTIDFRYRGIKTHLKPIRELKTQELKIKAIQWGFEQSTNPIVPPKLKEYFKAYLETRFEKLVILS